MLALTAVQLCLRAGIPHALGAPEAALSRGERHIDELGLAHPSKVVVAHQRFAGVVIRRIADLVVAQTRWSRPRKTSNVPLGGSKPSTARTPVGRSTVTIVAGGAGPALERGALTKAARETRTAVVPSPPRLKDLPSYGRNAMESIDPIGCSVHEPNANRSRIADKLPAGMGSWVPGRRICKEVRARRERKRRKINRGSPRQPAGLQQQAFSSRPPFLPCVAN